MVSAKKKNPLQNKKLAHASNRRANDIHGPDHGALELLPVILQAHLHDRDHSAEYFHGLSPWGGSVLFV